MESGAFTMWRLSIAYQHKNNTTRWAYYNTQEFWDYMDAYAAFIKKHSAYIDLYANIDVIDNPELTWRNQRYLEDKHKLRPVPVVHIGTSPNELLRYIRTRHDLIGLGGLAGSRVSRRIKQQWLDKCFNIICDNPKRIPRVKIHGFGVSGFHLLLRYPWWSVDSTTWLRCSSYGYIMIPHKRGNKFVFNIPPYIIGTSMKSSSRKKKGMHYTTISKKAAQIVKEWLHLIQIPIGKVDKEGKEIEEGVLTLYTHRHIANLIFFQRLIETLPPWPTPFKSIKRRTLL